MASTLNISEVIDRARGILQDEDSASYRWSSASMLDFFNDAEAEIVRLNPASNLQQSSTQLAAGTKQSLPSGGVMFSGINRNMGTDGSTEGNVPYKVRREDLDLAGPSWHTATAAATVEEYAPDLEDSKVFWVYPPQPSASQGYVELVYSALPTRATRADTTWTIGDEYFEPLVEGVVYRCYRMDTGEGASQRAVAHRQNFLSLLGMLEGAEKSSERKVRVA